MRPLLLLLSALTLGCGDEAPDKAADTETDTTDTTDTPEATCDAPGTPTTATPVAGADPAAMNIEALACTRTAVALACDVGAEHAYAETSDGITRTITANGIVNHDVGDFPNDGNPNTISAQSYTYDVPVTPSGQGATATIFGVLFSGAVLDPGTAETWNDDPTWRYEALRYGTAATYFDSDDTNHPNALGVDCNLAHVQPTGAYHYHGVPASLLPSAAEVRQVGWAGDGYPILIHYGHEDGADPTSAVRAMRASYRIQSGQRPAGSPGGTYDGTFGADWEYVQGLGDLDDCNGRVETFTHNGQTVTTYAYFLTDTFPYIPRCFHAAPSTDFQGGPGGGSGGDPGGDPGVGDPPACSPPELVTRCCGDGVCDGPETADNCAADCR
jgi:hypothetical protein